MEKGCGREENASFFSIKSASEEENTGEFLSSDWIESQTASSRESDAKSFIHGRRRWRSTICFISACSMFWKNRIAIFMEIASLFLGCQVEGHSQLFRSKMGALDRDSAK